MRQRVCLLMLLLSASPALGQSAEPAQPVKFMPPASTLSLDQLLNAGVKPDLPAASPQDVPTRKEAAPAAAAGAPASPSWQPPPAQEVAAQRSAAPPEPDLYDMPEAPDAQPKAAAPKHADFAHGVVLSRDGALLTLVGDRGFVHEYALPERLHLVDISQGGLAELDELGPGDFFALMGAEPGTQMPLVAFLQLGEQPSASWSELSQSVEDCYQQAVQLLERKGK